MCGILGWITTSDSKVSDRTFRRGIDTLFLLSETRGKEAAGVCCVSDNSVSIIKAPFRAKELIRSKEYDQRLKAVSNTSKKLVMGHARMVTNGSSDIIGNNQPITRGDLVCIHNGIITNSCSFLSSSFR